MGTLRVVRADLDHPQNQAAVLELTRDYARDPMGNGCDLPADVQAALIQRLRAHPTTRIFLAFDGTEPVGIATCFLGFSTFYARPLINVHDLHVTKGHRRRGVARRLLEAVEQEARGLTCCKLTLEVQEHNHPALALYRSAGFVGGLYQEEAGSVLFREKRL